MFAGECVWNARRDTLNSGLSGQSKNMRPRFSRIIGWARVLGGLEVSLGGLLLVNPCQLVRGNGIVQLYYGLPKSIIL